MAWQSSGVNNTEMVDKLTRFGIISSEHVETGFRQVDRKFFVPRGNESLAHSDQPLKEGNLHLSAPHIYAAAIEALNLVSHSSQSFLNVGSGTGYMSCIVADILGPNSLHIGVELHDDVILHCKESVIRWKANTHVTSEKDGRYVFHFEDDDIADIQIIKGNGLNISTSQGEGVVGFDRIYVGAAVSRSDLANIISLLSPGGILVGPVEDEFVKVVRVGTIYRGLESDDEELSAFDLNQEYTTQILSGVMFAPLQVVQPAAVPTVIPATVWSPAIQQGYPSEFKQASRQLFLCSNSQLIQPPRVIVYEERINAAALLPNSVWVNILSFTHRKWFEPEVSEVDYLKRRLREEKVKSANAERARREAEARCLAAERERALILRWQSRLNALLSQHDEGNHNDGINARPPFDIFEDLAEIFEPRVINNNNVDNSVARIENRGLALAGLRLMMQQLNNNAREDDVDDDSDDISSVANNEDEVDDMEEDEDEEEEVQSQYDSDLDDFASVASYEHSDVDAGRDRTDSVIMDDVDELMATGQRTADQPRTISMSSDDNL